MRNLAKDALVFAVGAAGAVYLVYPSLGIFEFLPDALPIVGSLDEGLAMTLVLGAARYYGVDLTRLFKRDSEPPTRIDDTQKPKRLPPR